MTAEVYHAIYPSFGDGEPPSWPQGYRLVATVETDALEVAFERTNHIDSDWTTNAGVIAEPGGQRSTSVGDIVVLDGTPFRCDPVGWTELPR